MRSTLILLAAAIAAVYAEEDCQETYKKCIAAGTAEVVCQCDLTTCSGEDAARIRDFCATATAGLTKPTSTTPPPSGTTSIFSGTIIQPPGVTQINAPAGSIPLGKPCGASEQCVNGAQCWAITNLSIRVCGNFQASCTSDSQCAYNSCNGGLCNGFLASSDYPANKQTSTGTVSASGAATSAPASSSAALTYAIGSPTSGNAPPVYQPAPTATASLVPVIGGGNGTNATTPGSGPTPYTGGAAPESAFAGFAAVVAGIAAWVM
ncbi:hypothetical protein CB0940_05006 [Cercospora beticola]|uniref:Extracellular membrane protein CFEM domain-containing protein n=1 Tax=Cercospora beticola TaxID=122368 RepID=A0A2G5HLU5_CERBT|nr:hypothetical protein CB0940_05006 [Cercospora beticola]PIA93534.1 hypothetical protein CB0940_05006 [Cercospora beticola]WPB02294.1 hypothetical protein RHO25_006928 [Cercospora beticola]CAK1362833.1 unnamed protein product [Cercospora beticola]